MQDIEYIGLYEAKLSAEEDETQANPWVPRASEDKDREARDSAPHAQGPHASRTLMPQKYRLSRADFKRMRAFKRLHGTFFSLSFGTIPDRATPGGAVVVSAKAASRAVERNLIKRRCRVVLLAILRASKTPIILVWHAKRPTSKASSREIQDEMTALSRKAQEALS